MATTNETRLTAPTAIYNAPATAFSADEQQQVDAFWAKKWKNHPLNRSLRILDDEEVHDVRSVGLFDWQYFITMKDMVYKFAQRGKMVSAKPRKYLRQMRLRNGTEVEAPYQTYYTGSLANAMEDSLYTEKFSLTHYDVRTHYKFTVGNFEAALRITKPLWKPRIVTGKKKNWQNVITPICFEFLAELQKELTGFNEEWFEDLRNQEVKTSDLAAWQMSEEIADNLTNVAFEREEEEPPKLETIVIDQMPYVSTETPVKTISAEEIEENRPNGFRRQDVYEFRWYPKISAFHENARIRPRKTKSDVIRSYFDDLAEVYLKIGRPDLAARISTDIRRRWLRTKVLTAYTSHPVDMYEPPIRWEAQSDEQTIDKCAPNRHREKIYRLLDNYRSLLERHRDKMEVMCHRGRFSYLKSWDHALYQRQRRIIMTMDERLMSNYVKTLPYAEVSLPRAYVEQAEYVQYLCNKAHVLRNVVSLSKALKALLLMIQDWVENEVIVVNRASCILEKKWEAQADEKMVGSGAPPSGGGTKTGLGVTGAASQKDVPATKASKEVTLSSVDQRETVVAKKLPVVGKKHPESDPEIAYTLQDMCKRPMMIDRFTWTTSDEIGKELKSWILPDVYFSADEKKSKTSVCQNLTATYIVACYGAMKFKEIKITIRGNTTSMNSGMLIFYFKPLYSKEQERDIFHNCTQFPHVIMDASVSNSVELTVPWVNPRDAFPVYTDPYEAINYIGTVHCAVWNPLGIGATGSSDASITVFMSIHGMEVYQLTNPKSPGNVHFASEIIGSSYKREGERVISRPFVRSTQVEHWESQGLVDDLVNTGTELVKDMGADLVETALQAAVGGAASLLAKPHAAAPPKPVTIISCQNPALGSGVDIAQPLRLNPLGCMPPDKDFSKPTTIRDCINTWSRIRVWELRQEDEENSIIGKIPVTPMLNSTTASKQIYNEVYMYPTHFQTEGEHQGQCDHWGMSSYKNQVTLRAGSMLDYFCRAFHEFNGDLEFKFEAVASLHSSRVLIRYEPYGGSGSATAECQKLSTPGVIWDVRENKTIIISVPLSTIQPMLTTEHISDGVVDDNCITQTACGILELTVLNKLKVTTGISPIMPINVYMRAGKNFEFAFMKPLNTISALRDSWRLVRPEVSGSNEVRTFIGLLHSVAAKVVADSALSLATVEEGGKTFKYSATGEYYPFVKRKDLADTKTASEWRGWVMNIQDFNKAWTKQWTNFTTAKVFVPPTFRNQRDAFAWLESVIYIPAWLQVYYRELKLELDNEMMQRILFQLSLIMIGKYALDVREIPAPVKIDNTVKPTLVHYVPKSGDEKEWEAQAKTVTPEEFDKKLSGVNPFKADKVPKASVKSIFGEDFMDIYEQMRRYQWSWDMQVPPAWYSDTVSNTMKNQNPDVARQLAAMSADERENWMWEIQFPVTPMTPYDEIGSPFTQIASRYSKNSMVDTWDTKSILQPGGADFASKATLTTSRWFGEINTMYSGGMRYGFTCDNPLDNDGKPWHIFVTYDPRTFCDWQSGRNTPKIVPKERVRSFSRQGQVNWHTNVQTTMFVEAPFYSKYRRLLLNDHRCDETTTFGSIIIHIPIRTNGFTICEDQPYYWGLTDSFQVDAPKISVMTAVADDMRYYIPRAAPYQLLWPRADNMKPSWEFRDNGYGDIGTSVSNKGIHLRNVGEVTKALDDHGRVQENKKANPLKGATRLLLLDSSLTSDDIKWFKPEERHNLENFTLEGGIVPKDKKKPEPSKKEWVAQGDEETIVIPAETSDIVDGWLSEGAALCRDFKETLGAAQNAISDITAVASSIKGATEVVSESVTSTSSTVKQIATHSFNATRLVVFFHGIKSMLEAENWNDRWVPLSTCALALGLSPDIVMKAGDYMMSAMSSIFGSEKVHETRKAQAYEDMWDQSWSSFIEEHSQLLRFIAAGVVTMVTFYVTSDAPPASKVSSFAGNMLQKLRNFAIVGTAFKTLDWMWKWISDVIKTALSTVADWASGGMFTASKMVNHYPEVVSWMRAVELYNSDTMGNELTWNTDARHELWKKMDEGDNLIRKISSKSGALYNTITRGMMTLQKAHDKTLQTRQTVPFRVDPFHVCLTGEPGVGKSAITAFVMNFVMDQLGYCKRNRFYNRCEEDEYWTKYQGQLCVLIDDLYSHKDGTAIMELIKMKSNQTMGLNMADLADKGREFSSHFIGSNTNVAFPRPDKIVTPMAVWRRRDVLAYAKQLGPVVPGAKPDWNRLRFDIVDPKDRHGQKTVLIPDLTLVQFLEFVTEAAREYIANQRSLVFSSLQGQSITLTENDVEVEDAVQDEVVDAKTSMLNMLRNNMAISKEYFLQVLEALPFEEFMRIIEHDAVKEYMKDKKMTSSDLITHQTRVFLNALKVGVNQGSELCQRDFERCVQRAWLVKINGLDKETYWPYINGVSVVSEMGHLEIEDDMFLWRDPPRYQAQSDEWDYDDWDGTTDNLQEVLEEKVRALRIAAEHSVENRNKLMKGHEDLITKIARIKPTTKKVILVDDSEITNYVKRCYQGQPEWLQKELVASCKDLFKKVKSKNNLTAMTQLEVARQFSQLFDVKHRHYWKMSGQDWYMEFNDAALCGEEEMELYTLYELMKEQWNQRQINECMDVCKKPATLKDTPFVHRLVTYYEARKADIKKWMSDHPYIMGTLKIGASVAAIFASYKVLSYLCPAVFDKITALLYGIFGWTREKIGEDRIAKIVETKNAAVAAVKGKTQEYYDWVKALMVGSGDVELVKMSKDDAAVVVMAEGLTRKLKNTKNEILMSEASRTAEGKKKMVNPYMLGVQDRVMCEGEVKNAVEVNLRKGRKGDHEAQGATDQNALKLRTHLLPKNMCRVMWCNGVKSVAMSGLFIGGRVLMMPSHFFNGAEEGQNFNITMLNGVEYWQAWTTTRAVKMKDQDVTLFMCTLRVPSFRKLIQHFVPMEDLRFTKTPATLNAVTENLTMITTLTNAELVSDVNYTHNGTYMRNAYAWEYTAVTGPGDCGAVLLADNNAITTKLLGMHVCGVTKQNAGSSSYVSREQLEEALSYLHDDEEVIGNNYIPQGLITKGPEFMKIQPKGNFELLGAVAASKAVRLPHKTEIYPSIIHDCVRQHVTEPAVLTANDPRNESGQSPLGKALAKYGNPTIPFPPMRLKYIADDIRSEVLTWRCPMGKRKLTDHEAVFGNEMIDYCDRMNLSASPGYPYTLTRPSGQKGKAYLFDINSADGIQCDVYRYEYQTREKLARAGMRKISVWTDCLKDERRPMEKIKAGKTRAFMLPPADFVQLCRKYFMAFCVAFYESRIYSFSAVGMDPYSFEWTKLIRKLKRKSNLGFGGDFHSFDGIFDPDILQFVIQIINDWYEREAAPDFTKEDNLVRKVLADEMIHTVHICLDSIYTKCQGNPSGNPLTVIINTFAHCFYVRLAWVAIAEREAPEMVSMYHYHKNVAEIYYGDDGLLSVKFDVSKWFNLESVSEELANHHIEYTSESKDEELYGVRRLTDCTFLKNGFARLENSLLWVAPISENTIYELTNWVRMSDDPLAQLRENLENSINFAFHHGRPFFERFCSAVNTALRARGLREIAFSYDLHRDMFESKCRA